MSREDLQRMIVMEEEKGQKVSDVSHHSYSQSYSAIMVQKDHSQNDEQAAVSAALSRQRPSTQQEDSGEQQSLLGISEVRAS